MDDCIKRSKVLGLLYRMKIDRPLDSDRWVLSAVEREIESIPAADVVEVVHGRWGEHIFDGIMGGRPRTYMCSFCNYTFPVKTNYCPNCGANMDGGDHDA